MLGSLLIGTGVQLDAIFYVLGGIGLAGALLTLLVPMARSGHVAKPVASPVAGPTAAAAAV